MAERIFSTVLGAQRTSAAYLSRFIIRRFRKDPAFEDISFLSTQQMYQDYSTRPIIFGFVNLVFVYVFGRYRYMHVGCLILWAVIHLGPSIWRWLAVLSVYFSAELDDGKISISHKRPPIAMSIARKLMHPRVTPEALFRGLKFDAVDGAGDKSMNEKRGSGKGHEWDDVENYEHTMMMDQTGFRCLLLKAAKDETEYVQCELYSISIDTPPFYEALSYSWGPRSPVGEEQYIMCSGKKILVSDNCLSALQHLRQRHSDRLLWVDAICIDQTNTDEANQQVQVMELIYQNAASVIVWLGPSTPESRLAYRYMAFLLQLSWLPGRVREWIKESLYVKIRNRKHEDVIVQLSHRAWFSRVWTIQEVALAQQGCCHIVCGNDSANYDHANGNLWITASELNIEDEYPLNAMLYHQSTNLFRAELRSAVLFKKPLTSRTMAAVMRYLLVFGATNPKDKVFGLYGILQKLGFPMPKPDYNDSLDSIYWHSTVSIIRHEPSLAFLSLASSVSSHIPFAPSWVPDYRQTNSFMCLDGSYHASKESNPLITLHNRDYELHVSGLIIEPIVDKSKRKVWEPVFGTTEVRDDRYFGLYDPEQCLPTINALQEWVVFGLTTGSRISKKYSNIFEAMMSVVTMGHLNLLSVGNKAYSDFLDVLCSTQEWWLADPNPDTVQFFNNARQDPQMRARFFDEPCWSNFCANKEWLTMCALKADEKLARVLHLVWAVARGNTVFETETGFFGLGSKELRAGDAVALVSGVRLPVVLRPVLGAGERRWMVVGTAYVYGMMEGEMWDEGKRETLVLV